MNEAKWRARARGVKEAREVWRKGRGRKEAKGGKERKRRNTFYFHKKNAQFLSVKPSTGSYQTTAPPATMGGQVGGRDSVPNSDAWVSDGHGPPHSTGPHGVTDSLSL